MLEKVYLQKETVFTQIIVIEQLQDSCRKKVSFRYFFNCIKTYYKLINFILLIFFYYRVNFNLYLHLNKNMALFFLI
jgi:hypothetical protein